MPFTKAILEVFGTDVDRLFESFNKTAQIHYKENVTNTGPRTYEVVSKDEESQSRWKTGGPDGYLLYLGASIAKHFLWQAAFEAVQISGEDIETKHSTSVSYSPAEIKITLA